MQNVAKRPTPGWRSLLCLALVLAGVAAAGAAAAGEQPATIATVAGTGVEGRTGDGGPAAAAEIGQPRGFALAPGGGYVFAEPFNETVRRVFPDGHIETIAGTGTAGYNGDGKPATEAELNLPHGVAFTPSGDLLIADTLNDRIREVSPTGIISTVAGTGTAGFSGDGGPATSAMIAAPRGLAALPDGGFLIPDSDNQRIRRVWPDGTITTVAGDGTRGFAGDGGPAVAAELAEPFGVAPLPDGGFLIADNGNNRIRRVTPDGTISTVAGDGPRSYGGDGGPGVDAALNAPHNVTPLPDGGFLIADEGNHRVRRVWPDGTITTVAGTGTAGFSGDGGPADQAALDGPKAMLVLPSLQGFLVADSLNDRVRLVTTDLRRDPGLRLATRSLRIRAKHQAVLAYTVSDPVTVRLDVLRSGRTVVRFTAAAKPGRNAFRFGSGLRPGTYTLTLRASAAVDKPATATATLRVTA
jgi:hypothetical protein